MIIQGLMDFVCVWLGGVIGFIPDFPAEVSASVDALGAMGTTMSETLGKFSPILPFDALGLVLALWGGVVVWWGVTLAVRLVVGLLFK